MCLVGYALKEKCARNAWTAVPNYALADRHPPTDR